MKVFSTLILRVDRSHRTHTELLGIINELRLVVVIAVFVIGRLRTAGFGGYKSRQRHRDVSSIVATIRMLKDPSWITRTRARRRCWLFNILNRGASINRRLVTSLGPFVGKRISIFEYPFRWPTFAWTLDNIRIKESRCRHCKTRMGEMNQKTLVR
jgi:hypothetical protein